MSLPPSLPGVNIGPILHLKSRVSIKSPSPQAGSAPGPITTPTPGPFRQGINIDPLI